MQIRKSLRALADFLQIPRSDSEPADHNGDRKLITIPMEAIHPKRPWRPEPGDPERPEFPDMRRTLTI